jgi:hypothetical protein
MMRVPLAANLTRVPLAPNLIRVSLALCTLASVVLAGTAGNRWD